MRPIELSPRLLSVANLVPRGAHFADIGTDHAYLLVWLIQRGIVTTAIAADLSVGPLERARQTAARYGLTHGLDFRLCDGLKGIDAKEVDTIAIAGMGGETIAAILAAAPWTATGEYRLILQPMSAQEDLRRFLQAEGYTIVEEMLSREGRSLYTTFHVNAGRMLPLTPAELWAGRQTGEIQPLRLEYLTMLLQRTARAIDGLCKSRRAEDGVRAAELQEVHDGLITMIEECQAWQQ